MQAECMPGEPDVLSQSLKAKKKKKKQFWLHKGY